MLEKGKVPLVIGATVPVVIQARDPARGLAADSFAAKAGDVDLFVRVPEGTRYDDPKLSHDEQFPAGGVTMVTVTALPGTPEATTAGAPQGWGAGAIGSGPQAAVVADRVWGRPSRLRGGTCILIRR